MSLDTQKPITGATETESEQRRDSIERFKAFLESHPPHPQYTPDSLYRLGMLMLEEADADFIKRVKLFEEQSAKGDAEDIPYPQRDQRPVISVFSKLIDEWPRYRDLDAALYARGYSYFEMGEERARGARL